MLELVFSPRWFYDESIIIDIFSLFTALLIGLFSINCYRRYRVNKKHKYFGYSFFLIALAYLAKIITNFTIFRTEVVVHKITGLVMVLRSFELTRYLFDTGYFFHRLLILFGLYWIYCILSDNDIDMNCVFVGYFILITTLFSTSTYFVFHITALLFISAIIWRYRQKYRKNKKENTLLLFYSFVIIGLSELIYVFMGLWKILYVVAGITQLIGYLVLIYVFIRVVNDGKKKKPHRNNK